VVLGVNKVDRPDARIREVVDEVYELFLDLDADESQIEFPILYANARAGWAATTPDVHGDDLKPLFEALLEHIPAPSYEEGHPLQALVTNLDASPSVGRLALRRPRAVDDDRHEYLSPLRAGRRQAHRAPGQGPARPGARRQRVDPRAAHRAPRHVGGPGPRRAPARGARRDDAPRGLRAH